MTPAEMTIAALVYVAALLLGQRAIAMGAPEFAEAGFAVGAVAGAVTAAVLYFRRTRGRGQVMAVGLSVGGVLAILAVVMGLFTQQLWETMASPAITLPIAAAGTLLLPLVIFPLLARMTADRMTRSGTGGTVTGTHVAVAAVAMLIVAGVAFALPVAARSNVKLVEKRLPGLTIALPTDWPLAESDELFEYGTVRYIEPGAGDKFLAVHWSSGDPVQADEYVKLVTGGQFDVRERRMALVGSHEGVTFYLESPIGERRIVTIWNCAQDHRVIWVVNALSGSKGSIIATQQRVIESVQCHTGNKPTTRPDFPKFVAPPGYSRDINTPGELLYLGPREQTIVFDAGVAGRNPLTEPTVAPAVVEPLIKELANLRTITDPPTLRTVRDLQGHQRRVWSAAGTTNKGTPLQVEVMIWYCDVRKMTFIGGYATRGKHDVQEGIDALLPAVCHQ